MPFEAKHKQLWLLPELSSKSCIKCKKVKPIEAFHKHKGMSDGRLNKCGVCVKEAVDQWRLDNPGCRAEEHQRKAKRKGIKTRAQYEADRRANMIGRKASSLKYAHKRNAQTKTTDELTDFVVEEMRDMAELRKAHSGFEWHIDHTIPINHKKVCGLHHWSNLQLVPASWNVKKGNRHMEAYRGCYGQ